MTLPLPSAKPAPGSEQPGDWVVRAVFADQLPAGTDLAFAARDSLIRYCHHFGLRFDYTTVHIQHGTRWGACENRGGHCPYAAHMHQLSPMVSSARVQARVRAA